MIFLNDFFKSLAIFFATMNFIRVLLGTYSILIWEIGNFYGKVTEPGSSKGRHTLKTELILWFTEKLVIRIVIASVPAYENDNYGSYFPIPRRLHFLIDQHSIAFSLATRCQTWTTYSRRHTCIRNSTPALKPIRVTNNLLLLFIFHLTFLILGKSYFMATWLLACIFHLSV